MPRLSALHAARRRLRGRRRSAHQQTTAAKSCARTRSADARAWRSARPAPRPPRPPRAARHNIRREPVTSPNRQKAPQLRGFPYLMRRRGLEPPRVLPHKALNAAERVPNPAFIGKTALDRAVVDHLIQPSLWDTVWDTAEECARLARDPWAASSRTHGDCTIGCRVGVRRRSRLSLRSDDVGFRVARSLFCAGAVSRPLMVRKVRVPPGTVHAA